MILKSLKKLPVANTLIKSWLTEAEAYRLKNSTMHLMYIDESGDTIPLNKKGKKFLVLTGCIFNENKIQKIEEDLRQIKQKFYQNKEVEIKSNFLRYASPDLKESSPLKLNSKEKYDELEKDISIFLSRVNCSLFSIVIHKKEFWKIFPAQNPYDTAYMILLEEFQKFLEKNKSLGICIIDPREGQVEKHFIGEELTRIHNKMRFEKTDFGEKCPNIIEKLLFSQSDKTIGIQIADLFCYPVFHVFEYNKRRDEYWRFKELTFLKMLSLKFYPEETKKDTNFFKK